jgi:hypothetical protein
VSCVGRSVLNGVFVCGRKLIVLEEGVFVMLVVVSAVMFFGAAMASGVS